MRFSPSTKKNNQAGIVLNSSVDGRETLAIEIKGEKQPYKISFNYKKERNARTYESS